MDFFLGVQLHFTIDLQKDFDILKHVEAGDFVISMRSFQGGIEYSPVSGSISSAYVMLIPNKELVYPPFYRWLLKSSAYIRALQSTTDLVRDGQAMRYSNFAKVRLLVAPLEEQRAIAAYLDDKVGQINSIIEEEKASIEEYKQWKAAIISEMVLGFNTCHSKKRSGVEWIDEIPSNWEIVRLKTLFSFGKGLPITKEDLVEESVPVISYGQIHSKSNPGTGIVDGLIRYVPDTYLQSNPDSLVNNGDILIADTSEDIDGCGNAVYVDKEMALFAGYHTIILRSKNGTNNKYLSYLFKSDAWRSQIRTRVSGVKLFSVSKKILNLVSVVLPPFSEQTAIVNELDKKCSEIDAIITEKESLMSDLEQFKRALIYDTVTGKRKVV